MALNGVGMRAHTLVNARIENDEKRKKCSRCFQREYFSNGEMGAPFGISGA